MMESQIQSQKFKFKFPKFLQKQKKSSKSNKRASISGALSRVAPGTSGLVNGAHTKSDSPRAQINKNQLKLKHAKSLDCLELSDGPLSDIKFMDDVDNRDTRSLRSEYGSTDTLDSVLEDVDNAAGGKAKRRSRRLSDLNGNCFTFPTDPADLSSDQFSHISAYGGGKVTPEKDVMDSTLGLEDTDNGNDLKDDFSVGFAPVSPRRHTRSRMLKLQSGSLLSLPVSSAISEMDESDTESLTESIFSNSDIQWERENALLEPGGTAGIEAGEFKPPAAPVTRKNSRRLSLSVELPRFRKRKINKENDDDDNVSVQSLDVSNYSQKKKSRRSLLRVSASLANLISPSRGRNDCEGFKVPSSPMRQAPSPYRPPLPSPAKRRVQVTWLDSVSGSSTSVVPALSNNDIKRQEAIYELYQGEKDMLEDLENVKKLYRDSLLTLGLMSQADVDTLFGNLDALGPVHQDLSSRLQEQRRPDGTTDQIGTHVCQWCKQLSVYVDYCANQIKAKALFDEKKNEPSIDDFFQRCLASPWSRKLDLWTFLDGARGRFVKYPLLIRSIQKYTASDSEEAVELEKAVHEIEKIIKEADHRAGQAKCQHSKSSLHFLYDDQRIPEIDASTSLLCSGCMKNNKSSKLYVMLFDKVAVMSRSTTQNGRQMYQVYRQPIPVAELLVEDLPDGEVKMGSFRNAFGTGSQTAKNLIRLSFMESDRGQSHTLMANDEHDKRQWMQAFGKLTHNIVVVPETKGKGDKQQLTS